MAARPSPRFSGTWIGLTLVTVPVFAVGLLCLFAYLIRPAGWAVFLTLAGLLPVLPLVALVARWIDAANGLGMPSPPAFQTLVLVWLGQLALLLWTHRRDLA